MQEAQRRRDKKIPNVRSYVLVSGMFFLSMLPLLLMISPTADSRTGTVRWTNDCRRRADSSGWPPKTNDRWEDQRPPGGPTGVE